MRRTVLLVLVAMTAILVIASGAVMASSVNEVERNDTRATAQSLDNNFSLSPADNPDLNIEYSTSVPHASVRGTGNGTNDYDWYSFDVPEGSTIGTLDIDGADPDWDSYLRLYDINGNLISRDHNLCNDGNWMAPDPGSEAGCMHGTRTRDGYIGRLERFPLGSGTYYVEVSANVETSPLPNPDQPADHQPIPDGLDYVLHVSVANHPTSSDSIPPETYIDSAPNSSTKDNAPTFTFSGSDLVTLPDKLKYSYKVDNGSWSDPSTVVSATLSSLSEGSHTFYVKAIDEAGNEDQTPAERSFTVDLTRPAAPTSLDLDAASDSGVSNTDDVTKVKEPTFKGEAEANSTVEVFDVHNNGLTTSLGTATANIDAPNAASGNKGWSLTVPIEKALTDGDHLITAKATDAATNTSASSSELPVKVDTQEPVIIDHGPTIGGPNAQGWYKSDVENKFTAEDALSGLVNLNQAIIKWTTSGEGKDRKVSSGSVSDVAGNTNPGLDSKEFWVDKTPPSLNPRVSPNPVFLNEAATASAGATDALSGVASSGCEPVNSSSAGSKSVSCSATDKAGNENTTTVSYEVVVPWTHKGFYSPVDMNGMLNIAKAGSAVPLKFEVFDGTTEIIDVSKVTVGLPQLVTCPNSTQDAIESYAQGESSLQYDTKSGQFIMSWKTPRAPGACYKVSMTSAGNSTPTTAWFMLK